MNNIKVWVLTKEYNDYDQHGEYFVEVFLKKPTLAQLAEYTGISVEYPETLLHILDGGGREKWEDVWFNLTEQELK